MLRFAVVEIAIALLLAAIVIYKFWPIITGELHFVHPGDTADLIYSDYVFVARSFKSGEFPLWNPHLFGGLPLSSYPQVGLFYPFNWLFWLLPYGTDPFPYQGYQYLVIFHVWLAGWLTYLAMRNLKFSPFIAILTGIVYMLTPNILLYIGWGSQITAFAWYPLLVSFLARTFFNQERIHAYTSGLLLGILILAAPAQPAIMALLLTGFFIGCFLLYRLIWNRHNFFNVLIATCISGFIIFMIGVAISSPSLLAIMEFAPKTIRFLGVDGDVVGKQKIPMHAMLTYRSTPEQFWGFILPSKAHTPMAFNFYGVVAFLISLFAAWRLSFKKPMVFFAVLVTAFSLTYAIGQIFPFIFYHLPFLNLIREPNKYYFYVSVMIAFLFAYGLEEIWKKPLSNKLSLGFVGLLAVTAGFATWQLNDQPTIYPQIISAILAGILLIGLNQRKIYPAFKLMLFVLLCGVLVYDLSLFKMNFVSREKFEIENYLTSQKQLLALKPTNTDNYRMAGVESAHGWPYGFNASGYLGLYDVFGYGNPIYFPFMDYRSRNGYCGKFYDLLNTKYFVTYDRSDERLTDCGGTNKATGYSLSLYHVNYEKLPMNDLVELDVYENTNRLGVAHLVRDVKLVPENKDPISFINDHVDVATQAAFVHGESFREVQSLLAQRNAQPETSTEKIALNYHHSNSVSLTVTASQSALLVSSDLYYPGWTATVNNQPSKVYEVNYIFRAVMVPAGTSTVIFSYKPAPVFTGFKLVFIAIVIIASQYYFYFYKRMTTPRWYDNLLLAVFLIMLAQMLSLYLEYNSFELKRYDLP